ncbi:hypothetical protein CO046_00135 [Candidatus Peregrinibacteria bacterium CG_4_9_14_0_2_um_filter_53_11]|nr:MAG: hypothetical protein CO046_00135 [Candidatus Peregrinibacteria bacterium CG_4_9_14_0_2_um_filter_53_11]
MANAEAQNADEPRTAAPQGVLDIADFMELMEAAAATRAPAETGSAVDNTADQAHTRLEQALGQ